MTKRQLPTYEDILWPTLKALEVSGGSASIQELSKQVASDLGLPDEILDIPHGEGPGSEFEYRSAWARTHLKYVGAVGNTSRGIWTITEIGRGIQTAEDIRELIQQESAKRSRVRRELSAASETGVDDLVDVGNWKEALLSIVRRIEPGAFERPLSARPPRIRICKGRSNGPFWRRWHRRGGGLAGQPSLVSCSISMQEVQWFSGGA